MVNLFMAKSLIFRAKKVQIKVIGIDDTPNTYFFPKQLVVASARSKFPVHRCKTGGAVAKTEFHELCNFGKLQMWPRMVRLGPCASRVFQVRFLSVLLTQVTLVVFLPCFYRVKKVQF